MNAGKLIHKTVIQYDAGTEKDLYGAPIKGWQAYKSNYWVRIKTVGGGEKYINQQFVGEATHQVEGRYISGVTDKMRILFGTRVFDIKQIIDLDMRHEELWFICKELV